MKNSFNSNSEKFSNSQQNSPQQQLQQSQSPSHSQNYSQNSQEYHHSSQHNNKIGKINYSLGIAEYLNQVNRIVQRRFQQQNRDNQEDIQDKQVKSIINEVLNKRKKLSRFSNISQMSQNQKYNILVKNGKTNNQLHIDKVNKRLQLQNQQLARSIRNFVKKVNKFNRPNPKQSKSKNNSTYSNHNIKNSSIYEQKQKQLEKLKVRLQKAERINSRMQQQLSKLEQSRKTNSKVKYKPNHNQLQNQNQIKLICTNCKSTNQQSKRRGTSNIVSPIRREDYYSPIMQFEQYSLRNQPTISLQQRNLQKTSQFGIQLAQSQKRNEQIKTCDKQTQDQLGLNEIIKENHELDQQIYRLEAIIKKNNISITKYEQLLLKQLI